MAVKILLSGCNGKMGKVISSIVEQRSDCLIMAGIDINTENTMGYQVFKTFEDLPNLPDVIIDFSHPSILDSLLKFSIKNNIPAVLCTTGYTNDQTQKIISAAEKTAIFYSRNMSIGINLIIELAKKAVSVLGNDFDIEIIEKHHNQKIDAPSGTALMIADAISDASEGEYQYTYDRHSYRHKRESNEIGLHSVRGGTIVGEHEVIFAGNNEVVSISHSAQSKNVFAVGAVNAAIYIFGKSAGLYDMSDLIK